LSVTVVVHACHHLLTLSLKYRFNLLALQVLNAIKHHSLVLSPIFENKYCSVVFAVLNHAENENDAVLISPVAPQSKNRLVSSNEAPLFIFADAKATVQLFTPVFVHFESAALPLLSSSFQYAVSPVNNVDGVDHA